MNKLLWLMVGAMVPAAAGAAVCPVNDPASVVEMPGFSCTLGDKTFGSFSMSGVPASALVQFGILNNQLFAVTLSRDGVFFPEGTLTFDYTVTAAPGLHILEGTVGVDVSFPPEVTVTTMNGQTVSIANGGTKEFFFAQDNSMVTVTNTSHILTSTAELNSISNDFAQTVIGIPEPGTLGLLFSGIGVLWLWGRKGSR